MKCDDFGRAEGAGRMTHPEPGAPRTGGGGCGGPAAAPRAGSAPAPARRALRLYRSAGESARAHGALRRLASRLRRAGRAEEAAGLLGQALAHGTEVLKPREARR